MPDPAGATGTPTATAHAHEISAVHRAGTAEGDAAFGTTAPAWQAFDTAGLPEHR